MGNNEGLHPAETDSAVREGDLANRLESVGADIQRIKEQLALCEDSDLSSRLQSKLDMMGYVWQAIDNQINSSKN